MIELIINDEVCDLAGNEEFAIDYSIFRIDDIDSRSGARSTEFKLPKTDRNRKIFDNADIVTSSTRVPYTRLKSRLLVDGVDQRIRFASLESSQDTYNVRLYGSNTSFYLLIKDKKLADIINTCEYNHFWSLDEIVNSRLNDAGYIYPVINYAKSAPNSFIDNVSRELDPSKMFPALFMEELVEKIVEETGYAYVNKDPSEETIILPFSGDLKRESSAEQYEVNHEHSAAGFPFQPLPPVNGLSSISRSYYLFFDNPTGGCSKYAAGTVEWASAFPVITFSDKIAFTATWSITIKNVSGIDFNNIKLAFTTDYGTEADLLPSSRNSNNYYEQIFSIAAGQTITLTGSHAFISGNNTAPPFIENYLTGWIESGYGTIGAIELQVGSNVELLEVQILEPNSTVNYVATPRWDSWLTLGAMFDELQSDLLKNYCKLLGLIIVVDEVNKIATFLKFNRILENIGKAKDWSSKLDLSATELIQYSIDGFAQKNKFIYQVDSPEAKPLLTDSTIDIGDENLPLEADTVEVDYASSDSLELLNGLSIPTIAMFEDDGTFAGGLTQRVLFMRKYSSSALDPVGALTIAGQVISDNIPIAWFINSDKENNLGFGNNIIERRYGALRNIIENIRIVSVPIRLNASDINQLDFTIPVWIEQFSSYFYISKVAEYKPDSNESTIVELVKLNIHGS